MFKDWKAALALQREKLVLKIRWGEMGRAQQYARAKSLVEMLITVGRRSYSVREPELEMARTGARGQKGR